MQCLGHVGQVSDYLCQCKGSNLRLQAAWGLHQVLMGKLVVIYILPVQGIEPETLSYLATWCVSWH